MSDARKVDASAADTASTAPYAFPDTLETQPAEPIQRSLFGEILDWMLVPLLLLWPMSIAITYIVTKSIANQPFDHALEDRVAVLAQQVKQVAGKVVTQTTPASRDMLRADDIDYVYFQIRGPHAEFIEGDRDMPTPLPQDAEKPLPGIIAFRNDTMQGTEIRIAYTYVDLYRWQPQSTSNLATPKETATALVQVGETLDKRAQLANEIIKGVIMPQFIILPIALALVWLALSRGLLPLAELQQRIRNRRLDDLSPIDSGQVPEEISPLINSFNDMLVRLSQSTEMQKRFIADAAHQMKTPLAGMRMQSELALRQTDQDEIHRSLLQLLKSSESATRLVNQLLALARTENQTPAAQPFKPFDLSEMARNAVHDWAQTSFKTHIDLGFEQPGHPIMIMGNALMLRELLNNLIDNALRYTPPYGCVTVRVISDANNAQAFLEIEDTGPGIPALDRDHIFERFYRILGSNVEGSGLGLAIVKEIAQQHDAAIDIFNNPHQHDSKFPGSLFRVTLHMHPQPAIDRNRIEDVG